MRLATLVVLAALLLLGCIGSPQPEPPEEQPPGPMEASSIAFVDGERIPEVFTCDGREVSPPFSLAGLPNATRSVALIAADPDVPTPETGARNFTHWLFWNAQPTDHELAVPRNDTPEGALEGENGGGETGYVGPCPPPGSAPHRYVFTFHAVDTNLSLEEGANRTELEAALEGHVLETTVHTGTYARPADPRAPGGR